MNFLKPELVLKQQKKLRKCHVGRNFSWFWFFFFLHLKVKGRLKIHCLNTSIGTHAAYVTRAAYALATNLAM